MATLNDVRRIALAFPGTNEHGSYGGTTSWKVGGKGFAWERPLRKADLAALGAQAPAGPILGIRTADLGMKEALLQSDREVFFTTPHFDGYPAVLIVLDLIGVEALEDVMYEAWLANASKRLVAAQRGRQPAHGRGWSGERTASTTSSDSEATQTARRGNAANRRAANP